MPHYQLIDVFSRVLKILLMLFLSCGSSQMTLELLWFTFFGITSQIQASRVIYIKRSRGL